jgi:hypothetical protein
VIADRMNHFRKERQMDYMGNMGSVQLRKLEALQHTETMVGKEHNSLDTDRTQ